MKVIFLDVDGVLNTDNLLREYGYSYVCPDRVILLKKIITATDAKIVLSSDWRRRPESRSLIREALKLQDLEFIDCTPIMTRKLSQWIERHLEISTWMEEYAEEPIDKFAIIDDLCSARIPNDPDSFFRTYPHDIGLTNEIANKIIEYLNS